MLLGLGAAWLIMFIYVVLITLRERKLRKELDRVRRMVESVRATPNRSARVALAATLGAYESPRRLLSVQLFAPPPKSARSPCATPWISR